MKKFVSVLLCVVLAAGFLAGCSGTQEEESVLKFYHAYFQDEAVWAPAKAMRDIYRDFQLMHIDSEVQFEPIALSADNAVEEMMKNEVAGGNFPEMIDLAGIAVPNNAIYNNLVYDMKPVIDADPELKSNVGVNYTQNDEDGKIYSIHDQIMIRGVWYNQTFFEGGSVKLPQETANVTEFKTEMDKIRASGQIAYQPFNTMQLWAELGLTDSGIALMTAPLTEEIVQSSAFDEFERVFKAVAAELRANGSINYIHNLDNFQNGNAALYMNGVWAAGTFLSGKPAFNDIKPGLFPGNVVLVSAGGGLTISNQISDAKKELAMEFVKYMVSDEVQERIFKEVMAAPCNPNVDLEAAAADSTDAALLNLRDACLMAQADGVREVPGGAKWGTDISRVVDDALKGCMDTNKDIDTQFAELKEDILGLLA